MTSAHVVETSVTNNSSFQNYPHPDDQTRRTTDTPGFKPFTINDFKVFPSAYSEPKFVASIVRDFCFLTLEQ